MRKSHKPLRTWNIFDFMFIASSYWLYIRLRDERVRRSVVSDTKAQQIAVPCLRPSCSTAAIWCIGITVYSFHFAILPPNIKYDSLLLDESKYNVRLVSIFQKMGHSHTSHVHMSNSGTSPAPSSDPPHLLYILILICQPCSCLITAPLEWQT